MISKKNNRKYIVYLFLHNTNTVDLLVARTQLLLLLHLGGRENIFTLIRILVKYFSSLPLCVVNVTCL